MVKTGVRVDLSIPQHKELSISTLRTLIRHGGRVSGVVINKKKGNCESDRANSAHPEPKVSFG